MNVDAANFAQSGQAGFGVVARDHKGTVLAANWGALEHVHTKWLKPLQCVRP
jgi:hypothetical protein